MQLKLRILFSFIKHNLYDLVSPRQQLLLIVINVIIRCFTLAVNFKILVSWL